MKELVKQRKPNGKHERRPENQIRINLCRIIDN